MENQKMSSVDQKQDSPAQDFFLYLVAFLSLAFVALGEGSILFGFINKFVSDKDLMTFPIFSQGTVKFGIAALLIAGPIFFIISRIITRKINLQEIALESKVRKWLTYIVMFVAAATIIGDLIALVVNFLEGDFPASFLLKVLVILLIAGGIFGYYFWDMRRTKIVSMVNKISALIVAVVLVSTFVAGFFIIDSPKVSRQKNIDQQTLNSLQSIDNSIQSYFVQSGRLPEKLNDLEQTKFSVGTLNIKGLRYETKSSDSYELCADFLRSNFSDEELFSGHFSGDWKHDVGNFCFSRIVLKNNDKTSVIGI